MNGAEVALIVIAAVLVVGWAVWLSAQRLDRAHRRVNTAQASLVHQLVARSVAALDLAHAGVLDPVSSILVAESARAALTSLTDDGARLTSSGPAQSELSNTVRQALGHRQDVAQMDELGRELVGELASAWYRVTLARRFYNQAVGLVRRRRSGKAVRALRLAGRTPMPITFEMDDTWPEDLPQATESEGRTVS
ncbi:MAG: hypothetical protein LBH48_06965 [Bifidobacteriaceae bacterium]|jgi:hypothetical protein|nr:hypothetical protein [Bifidobacteriaceae bacterium]